MHINNMAILWQGTCIAKDSSLRLLISIDDFNEAYQQNFGGNLRQYFF